MLARQIAIGFGIAIIFPLLVYYGVSTLHPSPKWQTFHETIQAPGPTATNEERKAFLDKQQADNTAYGAAAKDFARILIIVATPLGVGAILVGAYMRLHAIGTGLIGPCARAGAMPPNSNAVAPIARNIIRPSTQLQPRCGGP